MRVEVSDQGYLSAVEALVSGNGLAAQTATTLSGRLRASAGMAGDDSTATEFAASYDEGATASLEALGSMVGAFGALARMTDASLTNHVRADARATLSGWARTPAGPPTLADQVVGLVLPPPPSSLGADDDGPGGLTGMVLDHLQGVFWPNADTGRLRSTAGAWTTGAESVGLLEARCSSALSALEGERSPEIPVAVAVLGDVRDQAVDLAAQLGALGTACSAYADQVDTKRSELLSLLEDLAKELAVGAVVAGGLSLVSGGAATGLATGAGAARLASAGSKARGILDSLRLLTSGTVVGLRPVAVTAGEVTLRTERINGARVMLMEAGEQGAARGSSSLGRFEKGFLNTHENGVGHTLREHVGRPISQLRQRFVDKPQLHSASTFSNQDEAETAIASTVRMNYTEIRNWLVSPQKSEAFTADLGYDVGQVLIKRSGELITTSKVRIVLIPDETMPAGWRLLTAYPEL